MMKTIVGFSTILVLVLTLVIVLTVDAATPKDLIIHLPFEEGAGKVAKDISPNKFVGDVKNAKLGKGCARQSLRIQSGICKI